MLRLTVGFLSLLIMAILGVLIYPLTNDGKWDKKVWDFVGRFVIKSAILALLSVFLGGLILYLLGIET